MRIFWVCGLWLLLSGCRVHTLDDGEFELVPTRVLRDDCALNAPGPLTTATLRTVGHQVSLTLADPDLRLMGTYKYNVEEMTLDGTLLNAGKMLRGQQCLLDTVSFHMDTVTTSPGTFSGSMSIDYQTRQADACVCRYWFDFEARRK